MKKLVNRPTRKSVAKFIDSIENNRRREDSKILLEVMNKITGQKPRIWGVSIVGYGKYKYKRKNGDEFEWFNVGFSPGKTHLTVYVMYDINSEQKLLDQLGTHKTGKGCLYLKKLDDIDLEVLEKIISKSHKW